MKTWRGKNKKNFDHVITKAYKNPEMTSLDALVIKVIFLQGHDSGENVSRELTILSISVFLYIHIESTTWHVYSR